MTEPIYHYYLQDHQGNNRMVLSEDGKIEQEMHYYPFGGIMGESSEGNAQPFRYNGKEYESMGGLNMHDYGARFYDQTLGRWHVMDEKAEDYYNVSPYAYCMNNPVNAIDPDGKKVKILYRDRDGKMKSFSFEGTKKDYQDLPNNTFVKAFVQAYDYNKKNGGGDNMIEAVTNSKYEIKIIDVMDKRYKGKVETKYYSQDGEQYVKWESQRGLITSEGGHQSPATRLEHEFDHAVDYMKDGAAHRERRSTPVKGYHNKEEMRVIKGSESKTARANGEDVRKDHFGKVYDTISPISTIPLKHN